MSIGSRIAECRADLGISQYQLADAMGVTRGACGHWERNVAAPSMENLSRLARYFDVGFDWLATGRGEKRMPVADSVREGDYLPDLQQRLLREFRRLNSGQQNAIVALLEKM
ncbi:MAG: helix-turn-helix transcriptional regulator [Gammaproteobacteria bacterium]|nr:helix-turn-helix transcriptional regulator [Gammaproteobacteria bacterium]